MVPPLGRLLQAFEMLEGEHTTTGLMTRIPLAVCALGFDRSMLSRVVDAEWHVEQFVSLSDPEHALAVTAVGREAPLPLERQLWEAESVRRRRPLHVPAAQGDSRVHKELAEITGSTSYVVAPLMRHGQVIGLLHADRPLGHAEADSEDRDLLGVFAHHVSRLLDAAAGRERHDRLALAIRASYASLGELIERSVSLDLPAGSADPDAPDQAPEPRSVTARLVTVGGAGGPFDQLSPRELDVLALMGSGATNAQIARRLVISEGTVKSHVRHILRKLGAANRAEAVSRWLRSEAARA